MKDLQLAELDVSRETIDVLQRYEALVLKWTSTINLVAPNTLPDFWNRHIVDSAQVFRLAPIGWRSWIDIGSGAGFPGIVIAILDPERRPVTLVESDTRKALFLKTVKRELNLNLVVHNARIMDIDSVKSDILSARALSSLPELLGYARLLLRGDGVALFPKGRNFENELAEAEKDWHFDVKLHPSCTSPDSRILSLTRIKSRES